jgi:hypothetical protein
MTSSPHLEASKFEGKPIIFESSLSNSIIVDDSSRDDEIDMMNMDRPRDSTTTHDSSEAHSEGRLRSTSIDDEIYRPSNEYVLVRSLFRPPSSCLTSKQKVHPDSFTLPTSFRLLTLLACLSSAECRLFLLCGLHGISGHLCHYCQLRKYVG